jgi:hypothetical protein
VIEDMETGKPRKRRNNSFTATEENSRKDQAAEKNPIDSNIDPEQTSEAVNDIGDLAKTTEEKKKNPEQVHTVALDDYFFTKDDILGLDPSQAILDNPAWVKIQ